MFEKSFIDDGVCVGMSADWLTVPVNPFPQISITIARREPGKEGAEFRGLAENKLTLVEAIRAYMIDAAYQLS